jgi:hypothetical protein
VTAENGVAIVFDSDLCGGKRGIAAVVAELPDREVRSGKMLAVRRYLKTGSVAAAHDAAKRYEDGDTREG